MSHGSAVHAVNTLSTFASGYKNGEYFADFLSPIIEVGKTADRYQTMPKSDVTTGDDDLIGPDGRASEGDHTSSTDTYFCEQRAKKGIITATERQNADDPLDPEEIKAQYLMNVILLNREVRVATQFLATGSYASGNYSTASVAWSNEASGTPLTNLQTARAAIAPGSYPGSKIVVICALEVFQALSKHPQMTGGGALTPVLSKQEVAARIGVDEIYVSDALKNTARKGQTATHSRIWTATKLAMIRVPTSPPKGVTGLFGATFRYKPDGMMPVNVRTWEIPDRGFGGSTGMQVELADDEKIIQNDQGYLLSGVL